jgi:hypothetical protein
MAIMMPMIVLINALSAVLSEGGGAETTSGRTAVTVDNTNVAGTAGRVTVTVGTSCEAVAFWTGAWVGTICSVAVGRVDVAVLGASVLVGS